MTKFVVQLFIVLSAGWLIAKVLLIFAFVFWLIGVGDPYALIVIAFRLVVVTFLIQALLYFGLIRKFMR